MDDKPHIPVLLQETIDSLSPQEGDSYLDLTAGFGGHASEVAKLVGSKGALTLVDRDVQAIEYLKNRFKNDNLKIIQSNFYDASLDLLKSGEKYDCILADIGVSSYQLDNSDRGFTFSQECPLDMRMDPGQDLSAAKVLNSYGKEDLSEIFVKYGEFSYKQATKLTEEVIKARPLESTKDLAEIASKLPSIRNKRLEAQVFQAIRIEVNDELEMLKKSLPVWAQLLAPRGRMAVISFHSLEDRIVKQFFTQHSKNRYESDLKLLNKKPITANKNEKVYNPRARSAKLRAAVKK